MSILQTPSQFYTRNFNTSEVVQLAKCASWPRHESLSSITLSLFKKGTLGGSEQVRLAIYPTGSFDTAIAVTDWVSLASLVTSGGTWLGRVKFPFSTRPNLQAGQAYWFGAQTQNYTRNDATFYLGAKLDWPDTIHSYTSGLPAAQLRFTGYVRS